MRPSLCWILAFLWRGWEEVADRRRHHSHDSAAAMAVERSSGCAWCNYVGVLNAKSFPYLVAEEETQDLKHKSDCWLWIWKGPHAKGYGFSLGAEKSFQATSRKRTSVLQSQRAEFNQPPECSWHGIIPGAPRWNTLPALQTEKFQRLPHSGVIRLNIVHLKWLRW